MLLSFTEHRLKAKYKSMEAEDVNAQHYISSLGMSN
jgi:hypothetical protein